MLKNKSLRLGIGGLALGYFAFYVPYSSMTKALSKGLLPWGSGSVSGFEMLPAVALGTFLAFPLLITLMGWWKYAGSINLGGIRLPFASNKWTFFSGIATAVIILTTTLAYSFTGISIVFAALLMRGGVLLFAPMVDTIYKRKVHWYSWTAFGITMVSLFVLFAEKGGTTLTLLAGLNIAAYLSGYVFRLQFMTYRAKVESREANYRFFIEEMLVAMVAIIVLPGILALIGFTQPMVDLGAGFSSFLFTEGAIPALIIGGLYACLYLFGTRIYLDHRENTFCIPVNRSASLLAGVVATFVIAGVSDLAPPSTAQLTSAGLLLLAIAVLSSPGFIGRRNTASWLKRSGILQSNYLFVCSGNTSRSPMAQAICKDLFTRLLHKHGIELEDTQLTFVSAGLTADPGKPLASEATKSLQDMQVPVHEHRAVQLTRELVDQADVIWCMSQDQHHQILSQFPHAVGKVHLIDPEKPVVNPAGKEPAIYREVARQLGDLVKARLGEQHPQLKAEL